MLRSEQGHALLAALMVVVLLTALGTAGLTIATYSRQASAGELDRTQALYVADAGIELALRKLKVDPLWRDGFTGLPFGGGMIEEVTVTELSPRSESSVRVKVYSAGSYPAGTPRARKRVEAEVTISYNPFMCCKGVTDKGGVHIAGERPGDELTISSTTAVIGDDAQPTNLIFGGAGGSTPSLLTLTVKESMMQSGPVVSGNVYTRGNVYITTDSGCKSGSVVVNGGIWAGGTVAVSSQSPHVNPGDLVTGGTHTLDDPGQIPYFPASISATETAKAYYRAIAESYGADHYFSGDYRFTSSELQNMNGVYFVNGKAIIDGYYSNYTGRATIVAATYIEFRNGAYLSTNDPVNNVRGLISLRDTFFYGNNNPVQAIILCGDTLCTSERDSVWIDGAVTTWAFEPATIGAGGRRHGPCWRHGVPANTRLTYNAQLFKCYPPGMPYTVTIDSWKEL
ncbi:MAG: pilus assembly PilX N-terminal domain-containing protein [Bacillota bacterium]|jgi:hypothetical protein|nr:pilus assembly PilX N-terminal domain-containing protein [Thermoanaerobacteraceae bacterium]